MNSEIFDSRLQTKLKNMIDDLPLSQKLQLRSIRLCGSKVIANKAGQEPGVFLLKSEDHAKIWGTMMCKSPWACPVCTARRMAVYAGEIACAIDALRTDKYKQAAIMVTFTIMHYKGLSCLDLTEILYNSWKRFIVQGNGQHAGLKKKGWKANIVAQFFEEMNCKHRVRVTEYTYNNEHGWNPHFHCLFWVDKDKLQDVAAWEEKLRQRWIECVKNQWSKYRAAHDENPEHDEKYYRNHIDWTYGYGDIKNRTKSNPSRGLYISKDKNGKIREQLSSDYIAGWGADKELTGNSHKTATDPNSRTPFQLLQDWADKDDEEAGKLFIEYALATKKNRHTRLNYSKSGLRKIIAEWKRTEKYQENIKKKFTRVWRTLVWFTSEQWFKISELEKNGHLVRHNLLFLAAKFDEWTAWQLIYEYLLAYDIDISKNHFEFWADFYDKSKYCA